MERININEIKGFRIGQAQNVQAATGCTVILAGGSTFGLDAACGVMRFLEEKKIGRDDWNHMRQ